MAEYTKPGYAAYARAVVEEIKPEVDRRIRVLTSPRETGVVGSSLGGVVSFFMAWEYPQVFGFAACMSSTFSHKDDLIDRILAEPKHPSKVYLDSGWPGDNYEATRSMRNTLVRAGYLPGRDLVYFAFPQARHDEESWAMRAHIPFQVFFGDLVPPGVGQAPGAGIRRRRRRREPVGAG
jgi:predicted alpha/beta superfamily hydrolase